MNQREFKEYATVLLKEFDVALFDEEGEAGEYKKGNEKELTDYVFDVERSVVVLYSNGERIGRLDLIMDRSEEKGVYVEINTYSDNERTQKAAEKADRYRPNR